MQNNQRTSELPAICNKKSILLDVDLLPDLKVETVVQACLIQMGLFSSAFSSSKVGEVILPLPAPILASPHRLCVQATLADR